MRVAAYLDQGYWQLPDGAIVAERSFVLFLNALSERCDSLAVIGRLSAGRPRGAYRLAERIRFVELPRQQGSSASALGVLRWLPRALRRSWRALDDVDAAWLLGPSPLSLALVAIARLRRRRVVLGVRQDLPAYARHRHPRRRMVHLAADVMERAFRLAARRLPVVAVGPQLAHAYAHAPVVLDVSVAPVRRADVVDVDAAAAVPPRDLDPGPLTALAVGRLDPEKNPLLLADVLALLAPHWRLVVCGDGSLRDALADRLRQLGLGSSAQLRGNVALDGELRDAYRCADALLHVSHTEGLPQVIFEAFAAGLPVVATDVGGVREAVGDAALLVPPDDARAAADALGRVADDPQLRARLRERGRALVLERTLENESARVAELLRG